MATPETINLAALLAPIPGEKPAGEDVRYTGPHDQIKEKRQIDDRSQFGTKAKDPEWGAIIRLATTTLQEKSKDLQIAAWLTEALTRQEGFAGLRDGLTLLDGLLNTHWDGCFPEIPDGDLSFRVSPFVWMNSTDARTPLTCRDAVLSVPLTDPTGLAYGWLDRKNSREVDLLAQQNPDRHKEALAEGRITGEQFDAAVTSSPRAFYERLTEDVIAAHAAAERLQATLRARFGSEAPSVFDLQQAIEECRDVVTRIVTQKREADPDAAAAQDAGDSSTGAAPRRAAPAGGIDPVDRADALRRLAAVAAFFKRTEPHNPLAYLVERAIRWGGMPLEEWLREVVSSDDILGRIRETLGLPKP